MRGSVETAKRILEQGSCSGIGCREDSCPFYDKENSGSNTNRLVWLKNNNGIFDRDMDKVRQWLKKQENETMTKEDQIIEVVTAFKSGETIRRIAKAGNPEVAQFFKGGKLVQEWDFNSYRYEVVRVPVLQYRPLNPEELSGLVGTVLATKDRWFHILATAFNPVSKEVFLRNEWCTSDQLLDRYLRLDGSPVGVLIK